MEQQVNGEVVTDSDKMISLFAHLSTFFGGIILPIIFWAMYKEKSKFVRFHSLQSIFFHIGYLVFVVFATVFGSIFMSLGIMGLGVGSSSNQKEMPVIVIILIVVFVFVLLAVIFGVLGYSIYVGIKAYKGELKKYPIIGNIIYKKVYGTV